MSSPVISTAHVRGHPEFTTHNTPPNVLNRLHALFSSGNNGEAGPSRSRRPSVDVPGEREIFRAMTVPALPTPPPKVVTDRNALVIRLVTWNMGDAIPKGDLSVLLGEVPEYSPLEIRDGLPIVPVEDIHPYHIIVVAGQECPTESGAPRGIGGGLMKGMKLHGLHHHRKGKGREKEEQKGKEAKEDELDESSDSTQDGRPSYMTPGEEGEGSAESAEGSRATTPTLGSTPTLHRHGHVHQPVAKGWSSMLDDWLCGTVQKTEKARSADPTAAPQPTSNLLGVDPPSMQRSASAPMAISASVQSTSTSILHSRSPLARSPSSLTSSQSLSDSDSSASEMEASFQLPVPPPIARMASDLRRAARPEIIIPTDEPPKAMEGSKCYTHLTKQRLMGMYLSVYVHKDCRHLVEGVDKDFVTAGLAGGRLGNKGGIGISLKIADHRLLFVNSHLAAHTGRNQARMANIAKIKSELNLDCFLPKDDPRANEKDLTDRFDSVFWCGDLNFRLDVARLHAEWLVEQKKYAEALTWDQLRNAMMDPATNPFIGFEEGIIDFPPTFKYDVWKSVKSTNKDLRRSLRRRNSVTKPRQAEPGSGMATPKVLDHVPEADGEDFDDARSRISDDCRSPDLSRQSFESSRSVRSVSNATADSQIGRSNSSRSPAEISQAELNSMMNSHRPLDVKLKEKTRKLVQLVKIKTHLSPSPSIPKRPARSQSISKKPSMEFDQASRRTSLSSFTSTRERETSPELPSGFRPFGLADSALLSPIEAKSPDAERLGIARRPSMASSFGSPQRPQRAFSLKRTLSGRSMKLDTPDESEKLDMREDRREGVYDSSKKQRVPSWCDRVLWKAHPIPDLPEPTSDQLHREVNMYQERPRFGRLTLVLSNIGRHRKSPVTRTMSIEPSPSTRSMTPPPLPPHLEQPIISPDRTLVDSASRPTSGNATPTGQVPHPKPHPSHDSHVHPRTRAMSTDTHNSSSPISPVRHPLLQTGGSQSGSPARPRITIDPNATPGHDHLTRPRANSQTVPDAPSARAQLFGANATNGRSLPPPPVRRLTGEPAPAIHTDEDGMVMHRVRSGSGSKPGPDSGAPALGARNWARTMTIQSGVGEREDGRPGGGTGNAFTRFIHEIPNWLHRNQGSSGTVEPELERSVVVEEEAPRRHMQGEVVCLHYGTIDDAGMRLLEGRSDHRPAIFAAAIYL